MIAVAAPVLGVSALDWDHLIHFDPEVAVVRCMAGLKLKDGGAPGRAVARVANR
jgi:hypothetical protein